MNNYSKAKEIFIDGTSFDYVNIGKSVLAYEKMVQTIKKPLKLILLFGKPGTGKTYLLKKIHHDLSRRRKILFYPAPFFNEVEFLKTLHEDIFNEKTKVHHTNYDELLKIIMGKLENEKDAIPVLIDEAQLYPPELIEKIRLLADSRKFKFVFTVHKTDEEDVLAKDYFKTRIWETIEIENSEFNELKSYIEKKFLYHNMFEYLSMLKENNYKMVYKLTNGNLRETNKLLYKLFEIYEYYDKNYPSKIGSTKIKAKILEMAAMDLRLLNA